MNNEFFEEKYSLYSNLIFKLAMTYLCNKSDAEDITQEVFVKLLVNPPKFESLQHERHWIIRVTINLCKNHLGTFWNKKIRPIEEASNLTENYPNNEITEMLFKLAPKYRIVLYMYYYEGYKMEEIAKILNISLSSVKMRMKRGREKLKLDLEVISCDQKGISPCNRWISNRRKFKR